MEPLRLNKWLVQVGHCSRREADRLIEAGRVTVDGKPAILGLKVTGEEKICVDRKAVNTPKSKRTYIVYHKPVGIICSSDPKAKDNIIDAIHYPERIFNVGRLDVASSGLILLTNDGAIVNQILRAQGAHEKEYAVTVDKPVTPEFLQHLERGVMLDDRLTLPAVVSDVRSNSFHLTIVEGRNRQVRRMCEAFGYTVQTLCRVRIMHITLGNLKPGAWRHLTPGEESELLTATAQQK